MTDRKVKRRIRAHVRRRAFRPTWELESLVDGFQSVPNEAMQEILRSFADNKEFWEMAEMARRLKIERDELLQKMEQVRAKGVAAIMKRYKRRGAK